MCLENLLFFPCGAHSPGNGGLPWEAASAPCSGADSVGQAQERGKCQRCGVMPLLHRPHIRGTSPNTQPHSLVFCWGCFIFPHLRKGGRPIAQQNPWLRGQHMPCSRKEMELPGSPPFTLACPGDSQHVNYSSHPQEGPVSHPCPCVPSLPLCHTSALRCRRTMDRGSHLGCLSKAC